MRGGQATDMTDQYCHYKSSQHRFTQNYVRRSTKIPPEMEVTLPHKMLALLDSAYTVAHMPTYITIWLEYFKIYHIMGFGSFLLQ